MKKKEKKETREKGFHIIVIRFVKVSLTLHISKFMSVLMCIFDCLALLTLPVSKFMSMLIGIFKCLVSHLCEYFHEVSIVLAI